MDVNEQDFRRELVSLGGGAHALAAQLLHSSDEAADAVHDAYAQVLARPGAFDARKGPLRPWFLRVVRNRCLDLLRKRRPGGVPAHDLPDPADSPERHAETEQRERVLRQALAGLPGAQREILVLRDYLDLSYAEIADVLSVAPGTVMSRLHRARLALREEVENREQ